MDASQWAQVSSTTNTTAQPQPLVERKPTRPLKEQPLNCPRCNSINTKFCYYNNYSLSQPRYYCKSCKRYWTQGGSLRNVPIGGGSRKNKKHSSTTSNPSQIPSSIATSQILAKANQGQDLSLNLLGLPAIESVINHNNNINIGSAVFNNNGAYGFNDFGLPSYMKLPNFDGLGSANLGVEEGVDHGLLLPNIGETKNFYTKSSNETSGHQNNPGSSLFWNVDFNGSCGSR